MLRVYQEILRCMYALPSGHLSRAKVAVPYLGIILYVCVCVWGENAQRACLSVPEAHSSAVGRGPLLYFTSPELIHLASARLYLPTKITSCPRPEPRLLGFTYVGIVTCSFCVWVG